MAPPCFSERRGDIQSEIFLAVREFLFLAVRPVLLHDCVPDCRQLPCPDPFDRVVVSFIIRGGTRVMWSLRPTFTDPGPLTFRLEVGSTANPNADDWQPVGPPLVDQFYAIDFTQRVFGKSPDTHYRVRLTTSRGEYVSAPVGLSGTLSQRDWRLAREIVRKELVAHKGSGQLGVLLKRRVTGTPCPDCLDELTREVRDPNCPTCYGTGFRCGYYYPLGCVWASLSPLRRRPQLDGGQGRGTVDDQAVSARMTLVELVTENDIWVALATDQRYYLHGIQHVAEWRGVPLVGVAELRPIPYSSVVYRIPVPQQDEYVWRI